MILHVPLLLHNDTYSIFLQVLKTHMADRVLQFLDRCSNILDFYYRC